MKINADYSRHASWSSLRGVRGEIGVLLKKMESGVPFYFTERDKVLVKFCLHTALAEVEYQEEKKE